MTNPTYQDHTDWWDVLCNIDTGKITISSCIAPILQAPTKPTLSRKQSMLPIEELMALRGKNNPTPRPTASSDTEFINDLTNCIQSHYGESAVRAKIQDYVFRFVRLAALYEETNYGHTNLSWKTETNNLGYGPVFIDEATRQRELKENANRIEAWRQTISYKYFQKVNKTTYIQETSNNIM